MLWTESCNNASLWTSCCSGYFTCNTSKVSFDNGNVPLLILFINNPNAPFTFPFPISCLDLDKIFSMIIGLVFDGSLPFFFVLLSSNNPLILPSSHNFIHFSSSLKCSLAFDLLLGFCRSNDDIIWIVFNTIFFSGVTFLFWNCNLLMIIFFICLRLFLLTDVGLLLWQVFRCWSNPLFVLNLRLHMWHFAPRIFCVLPC